MMENGRNTYGISEAARELGISAKWLRVGEKRGYFPLGLGDRNGHRYYTEKTWSACATGPRPVGPRIPPEILTKSVAANPAVPKRWG
jgi:hypothetical protein